MNLKIPDSFPPGCSFVGNFSGDDFVRFPDGSVFKLADSGAELIPVAALPPRGAPISEAQFLGAAAGCRAFTSAGVDGFLAALRSKS